MLQVTLDTACIIDAAEGTHAASEIHELVQLARDGKIGVCLTSGFEVDQVRASEENYRRNLAWLSGQPIVRIPGVFRLDVSVLDGPDVLASDEVAAVDEKIMRILRPSWRPGQAFPERKVNDVHHLSAHYMSGNAIFVTRDNDDIIRRAGPLKHEVGIVVMNTMDALAYVKANI